MTLKTICSDQQHSTVYPIFKIIESGIQECAVEEFDRELGTTVSIAMVRASAGIFKISPLGVIVLSGFFLKTKASLFRVFPNCIKKALHRMRRDGLYLFKKEIKSHYIICLINKTGISVGRQSIQYLLMKLGA